MAYPGDDCCVLYEDGNFGGHYFKVCSSKAYAYTNLHDYGWGDVVSSWACGKNVKYDLCNDVGGSCQNGHGV